MAELAEQVAVVTGGSRGIGRAIALELANRGATVVVNYRSNADAANEVVAQITESGGQAVAMQADISDEAAIDGLIKGAIDQFEKIDILVNNAGTSRDNVIMRLKTEDFDDVINTNLRSAWIACRAVTRPMMRKRYGRIINISSISGVSGQAGQSNYSASKAGLIGMSKSLARELASRNVTVNVVAPGFVETDMTADLPDDVREWSNTVTPMARWGKAEEIAHAVAFLASPMAAYITGHVLAVDGGLSM